MLQYDSILGADFWLQVLQVVPSIEALALLFVFLTIWLKTSTPGFGLFAVAEGLSLAMVVVNKFTASYAYGNDNKLQLLASAWLIIGAVRLAGAVVLYKYYRSQTAS